MSASPKVGSAPPKAVDGPTRSGPTVILPSTMRTTDSPPIPTEVTAKDRTALGYSRMDTPFLVINGLPYFHKEISVVVPPISKATVCSSPIAPRADRPSTVAAGPVKAVSTGRLTICSIGKEPPSAFKIWSGALILRMLRASSTLRLKIVNTGVTALLK